MANINANFLKLQGAYLFPEIERRIQAFIKEKPDAKIIRMGIGDVTEPLVPAVTEAMHRAIDDLSKRETFRGYGPHGGYPFLREAIAKHDYQLRGCDVAIDEIFVSDGSKPDNAHILDILGENRVAIADPVYPVYLDTNVMAGNTDAANEKGEYGKLIYLPCTAENHFTPALPSEKADVIYLCSPNNPTGTALSRATLEAFVAYAKANDSLLFFDGAYEAFIEDPTIPHSIFEIDGARDVAIEFRSFSKTAGFTGLRIAYCVVPKSLRGKTKDGREANLNALWMRRHTTKSGGVNYVSQRAAEATFTDAGKTQLRTVREGYMTNAKLLRDGLAQLGMTVFGGENSPFLWLKTPSNEPSWNYFDRMLRQAHVVCTPGAGFGRCGEGYVRISAFNSLANTQEAIERIRGLG